MPLGVFNPLRSAMINISAWAFIVYSCYKVFQYLRVENKQKEVPRFLYIYTNGVFGANFPQNKQNNEKTFFNSLGSYISICRL